jgi:ribosomal protein S18 acetylase RimI-like enzyme
MKTSATSESPIVVRPPQERDLPECGRICYEAFAALSDRHGFPHDFPNTEVATSVIELLFSDPGFHGVVAERNGRILGSNWLDERNPISGIGPITIDPAAQDSGVGRRLMDAVIARSDERGFPGVRLVQAGYHARSLSLYTKLGFASREELAVMDATPIDPSLDGYTVEPATQSDVPTCNELCISVHGVHRGGELQRAISAGNAFVARHGATIRAYTTGLGYFGHTVGETNEAICALLAQAPRMPSLGVLLPVRNYQLFRWCLNHGMRVLMTMTLMSRGLYQEPSGPYLTSILY